MDAFLYFLRMVVENLDSLWGCAESLAGGREAGDE